MCVEFYLGGQHMIICSVNQISKIYGGHTIFENITFEIKTSERIGLVGRNGSGKSSLLKIITGEETPDHGAVHWKKNLNIGYLAQIPNTPNTTTAYQFLLEAFSSLLKLKHELTRIEQKLTQPDLPYYDRLIDQYGQLQDQFSLSGGYEIDAKIARISSGLKISHLLDRDFCTLSGGEKTKLGLAYALLQAPELLILDEPTNHLDMSAIEWLGDFLKDYSGSVLLVSHDRYFLDQIVNKIIDLEEGQLTIYPMNYSQFMKAKEERLIAEFKAYQDQQKKIKKMKETIKQLRIWANQANPPNEGLHKRARNMERALERMKKLSKPVLEAKRIGLDLSAANRSGQDVIVLKNVSKAFQDQLLFEDINLSVYFKDRVAIIGDNGTGKSTLLKIMLGELDPDQGGVKQGSQLKIGYLSQQPFAHLSSESVMDVFRDKVVLSEARHFLARFMFYGHHVYKKISQLSGGERMRLRLAQLMQQDINLLVLDEPTNHLDIESIEVLEDVLEQFQGTIIAVSHDRYFINKLFTKIYWIEDRQIHHYLGNYQEAKQKRQQLASQVFSNKQATSKTRSDRSKTKLNKLEADIIKLEEQLEQVIGPEQSKIVQQKQRLEAEWAKLVETLD